MDRRDQGWGWHEPLKIVCVASTLDLRYRLGCTPSWWQWLKAFHEEGHEVIAAPYLGDPIESPWWRTVANPCAWESKAFNRLSKAKSTRINGRAGLSKAGVSWLAASYVRPRWLAHLRAVLRAEQDVDLVLMLNIPVNQVQGIPEAIRSEFGVRVVYYDGDMPAILPEQAFERGFKFSYYDGADLSEYDAFYSNSFGASKRLRELGAKDPKTLHYAADPDLFVVGRAPKTVDVAFYGHGSDLREDWMRRMIAEPSQQSPWSFAVGGRGHSVPLGRAKTVGHVPFSAFGRFVGKARINLSITRNSHTRVPGSSTARPFELAAFGACMVSNPYPGLEEWFVLGRETVVLREDDDAVGVYRNLLEDSAAASRIGDQARAAVLQRHTWRHRVQQLIGGV